jgi:hypothetical protein
MTDMAERFEGARHHPQYERAMTKPPPSVGPVPIVIATVGLGVATAFPFLCLAVASHPPAWVVLLMGGLALIPALILRASWRRYRAATSGLVRRELCLVVAHDTLRVQMPTVNHFLTLHVDGNAEPKRYEHPVGVPLVQVGDIAVALFRDNVLIEAIRIPPI